MLIKRSAIVLIAAAAAVTFLGHGMAQATPINFTSVANPLGTSQTYGAITAFGYTTALTGPNKGKLVPTNLYAKTDGGGESGLGLAGTIDNEVNAPTGSQAIILNIKLISGQDIEIGFGSVQKGAGAKQESWKIGFSSSAMMPDPNNVAAFSDFKVGTTDFPNMNDLGTVTSNYLIIEAGSGNILLTSLDSTTSTGAGVVLPEPASMALLGFGLAAVGIVSRRNKQEV